MFFSYLVVDVNDKGKHLSTELVIISVRKIKRDERRVIISCTHGISTGQIGNYSSPVEFRNAILVIAKRD